MILRPEVDAYMVQVIRNPKRNLVNQSDEVANRIEVEWTLGRFRTGRIDAHHATGREQVKAMTESVITALS